MEVLKNLCKINLHLKDASWIWWTGLWETGRNKLAVCCAHPRGLPSCFTSTGFRGSAFPAAFAFSSATLSFVTRTMGTITSALKCIYKYSLRWCNWHKTQTAQLLSHVNISNYCKENYRKQEYIPGVGRSHDPGWHAKKAVFFSPLKIMYFPGTVQMSQMRQIRDLFWPTYEKTPPPALG